jgi:hypothetical protein
VEDILVPVVLILAFSFTFLFCCYKISKGGICKRKPRRSIITEVNWGEREE